MAKQKYDSVAKTALRQWPNWTNKLWPSLHDSGRWLRAQPKSGHATCPQLAQPGMKKLFTRPDGMWIFLTEGEFVDVVCVEDSSSQSNLNDKRSRYMHASHSLVVHVPLSWLLEVIPFKKGLRSRWKIAGTFSSSPVENLVLPVRHLRVLYALTAANYQTVKGNLVPAAHEFFCRTDSLTSYNGGKMQDFLRRMWFGNNFYTKS